jgi:NAD(P)-dependent dehydrogenase (short-subunit alcohol dehydrogenase family)
MQHKPREGLTVLVTGASSGFGRALAQVLAARGHRVFAVARRGTRLRALAREAPGSIIPYVADLRRVIALRGVVRFVKQHGGIDVLVNNAAIYDACALADIEAQEWREVLDINLRAPVLLCAALLPVITQRRRGLIINVVSGTATCGGELIHRISKVGLEILTRAIAEEHGKEIIACSFNPGWMRTEMSESGAHPLLPARALVPFIEQHDRRMNGRMLDYRQRGSTEHITVSRRTPAFGRAR